MNNNSSIYGEVKGKLIFHISNLQNSIILKYPYHSTKSVN